MAIPGYMWIKDENGNEIQGSVNIVGREGSSEVLGFKHNIYIPSDRDTGVLTGTRKHDPFVVTKSFCNNSPILNKACASGKTLKEVMVRWYKINETGSEEEYFNHTLSNVKVVSVSPYVENVKDKSKDDFGHLEEVHFRYEKIQWNFLEGNIVTEDQWNEK